MSLLLKDTIHSVLADSIFNDLLSRRSNYYYFIGKVMEWDDQNVPDTPEATFDYEYETRNNIISLKKINISDVSYVVRRIDWTSGQVFDQYDQDYTAFSPSSTGAISLKTSKFYALTADFNVYVCLNNNSGAASTSVPTNTDSVPINTADGYIWKYLYTIPLSSRNKFLSAEFMPVTKAILNPFYSNGSVSSVVIDNAGSGYLGNAEVTLTVQGIFKGGSGNLVANLRPVLSVTGEFLDVVIVSRGNNYASANILISDIAGLGTGKYNTAGKANLVPVLYNTQIDRVVINDPGIKYSANNQTIISSIGDGIGASFVPYINTAGQLEDVIITSRGEGYSYIDLEVVGDGINANVYADLSVGDLETNQSTVELSAIDGAVYTVKIFNGGNNYSNANVTLEGDGADFVGVVNISNTNTISSVTVLNPGYGFTHANVVITGSGTGASANAILSPFGGHGRNSIRQLFSDAVMLYTTINNEKNQGVDVNNDYRQIGIIKDPLKYNSNGLFANTLGSSCFLANLSSTTSIIADMTLELAGNQKKLFEVVQVITSTNQVLMVSKNNYTITTADSLYNRGNDLTYTITSIDALPTINKFSGDMIYIDNRTKISYSDQQLVTIRTVIKL